jgi:hypothetical protein
MIRWNGSLADAVLNKRTDVRMLGNSRWLQVRSETQKRTNNQTGQFGMDEQLLRKLAGRNGVVPSPGDSSFIMSPTDARRAIQIAVIHPHRFAFNYWLRWSTENWTESLPADQPAPDLVTIDYHDDVGGECDCVFDELDLLVGKLEVGSVDDEQELKDATCRRRNAERNVSLYSMLGLRGLNDGHIFPAQHLNAIGDVFVLYKQREPSERSFTDPHGNEHRTRYFNDSAELISALEENPNQSTYFDLDVDYFFEDKTGVHGEEVMVPDVEIRQLMNPDSDLMLCILQRDFRGVTFALEPTYCGGLPGCFKAMSIVMESLLTGDLLGGSDLAWR